MRTNSPNAKLPKVPTRPAHFMSETNYNKYTLKLQIYNKHMKVQWAMVEFPLHVFLDGLVGEEVEYKQLPPNLTAKDALTI